MELLNRAGLFLTFCNTGIAQSTSIREILSLPPRYVFNFSWTDPHPPPYLRVLLSFEWCRQLWGKGPWDEWEYEWLDLYTIKDLSLSIARTLKLAKTYLPTVSRAVLYSKFKTLNWKRMTDLFDLSDIAPWRIAKLCRSYLKDQSKEGLSPCLELAVLRYMRDNTTISKITIDNIMTNWLIRLKQLRKSATYQMLKIP